MEATIDTTNVSLLRRRAAGWLLAVLICAAAAHAAERKPNFLFVYTDDQRWDAMGVVQREQGERARFPWFRSPNMDRLAAEGVRFRNAFVTCSLCSPSRAAFLTGRYNHLNGITNNHAPFPENSITHATLLRAAGYRAAYIGKWHMGNQRGQRPGFDYSASFIAHGRYQDCPVEINGVSTPTKGWVDDVSTDYAIEWMRQNRDQPFLIVVGFKSPHSPRGGVNLPERLRNLYAGETSRPAPNFGVPPIFRAPDPKTGQQPQGLVSNAVHLDYLRHVAGADENLGRLLDALDQLDLAEDTMVVYTSDNGYYLGEHCSGDKRSLYEESLRIPMVVRYPRLFGKGRVVDEMVLNIDLAPTFLDLAGVPVPREMQGMSWKSLAAGQKLANWRQSFLAEYFYEEGVNVPTMVGVCTVSAKFVKYPRHDEWTEAFDLAIDPYELKNLAADPAVTAKLSDELNAQVKAMKYFEPPDVDKPPPVAKSKPVNELQQDFLKLKFGMFIHFNLETFKGVQWVSGYHSPADFNPGGKVDTDAWADAAVSAGMKYAVLTAKHVSGFCLWDSKYTTCDVMNPDCPYQQDLVAQFIRSFKSRGLKVGLYYCWRHPGFKSEFKVLPPECDPATHTMEEQIDFQKKQIAELVAKYPDVFYLWNDALDPRIMPADEALGFFRGLRWDLLASANWWDWGKKGTPYADIAVKEMRQFPENNTAPGETCWCLEQSWFWHEGARPKTAKQVLDLLTTVNSRNSNFLLNVGPNKQGRFEEASVNVLAEVGRLRDRKATSGSAKASTNAPTVVDLKDLIAQASANGDTSNNTKKETP